jgi:pilus assembly protein CpaC
MHRKNCVPRTVYWKLLLGLVVGCLFSGRGIAQEVPPPKIPTMTVPINGTKPLQMSTKKRLKTVTNQDPNVARVAPKADDPNTVLVTGLRAGTTKVTLTDIDDKSEEFIILVQTDVEHLKTVLRRVVPTASLVIEPVSESTIVISGTVEKTEDINIILQTAQGVGGFQIVNAMRVGGVVQVQLCVTIARVNRTLARNFGFNFLFNSENTIFGSTIGNVIPALAPVGVPSGQLQPPVFGQILNSTPFAANLFGGNIHPLSGFLGFLEALESEGVAKVMAEPKLVTLSGRPASFLDGGEQAVPVPAGLGQVGIQFEEFGTRLNFLPIVLGNGRIHLEVEPEVSALSVANGAPIQGAGIVPGRVTQRVHTTVELEDGQTFAIGGLIQRTAVGTDDKVPVLGYLPFVGALFSTKGYNESETELVVLVTPRLVDAMDCKQIPKLLPGQETRSPDDFELYLEGILEAPRGPREVFPHCRYLPAYKNGPTAGIFPCGGNGNGNGGCGNGRCGGGCSSCGGGSCGACGGCGSCGGCLNGGAPCAQCVAQAPVTAPQAVPQGVANAQPMPSAPAEASPVTPTSASSATADATPAMPEDKPATTEANAAPVQTAVLHNEEPQATTPSAESSSPPSLPPAVPGTSGGQP